MEDNTHLNSTVLYLDDEKENLDAFKMIFRNDYSVYTAQSSEEAFSILKNIEIKVVISDQRMPQMSGTEFLSAVTELYPNTIRIILTAFVDMDSILEAVNIINVYRYLSKPWNKNDLKLTIDSALEIYNLKTENQLLIDNLIEANSTLQKTNENLKKENEIRKNTEHELEKHQSHLEDLVKARTAEIQKINQELLISNSDFNLANKELEEYKIHLEELVEERTKELLESEKRIKSLSNSLPGGIIFRLLTTDLGKFNLLYASMQFEEILGIDLNKCLNDIQVFKKQIHEADLKTLMEELIEAIKEFKTLQTEFQINTNSGLKWLQIKAKPSRINNHQIIWDGFAIDITQRKNSEIQLTVKNNELLMAQENLRVINDELRDLNNDLADKNNLLNNAYNKLKISEEKYFELFDKMINGFAICEAIYNETNVLNDFRFLQLNPAFEIQSGLKNKNCLGKKASEIPLAFDEFWYKKCTQVLDSGQSETFERFINAINRYLNITIYKPAEGQFALMFEDISKRKNIELALRESEEKYRLIVEGQTDLIVKLNDKQQIQFASPSFCKAFNINEKELLNRDFKSLIQTKSKFDFANCYDKIKQSPYSCYFEFQIQLNNKSVWLAWHNNAILNEKNEIREIVSVGRDITERKIYEKEILSKNQFLEGINNTTPDSIFIVDILNSKIEFCNNQFRQLLDLKDEDVNQNQPLISNMVYHEDKQIYDDFYASVLDSKDKQVTSVELRLVPNKGNIIWTLIRVIVLDRCKNNVQKIIGIVTDITELKIAEESIRQSAKRYRSLFEQAGDGILVGSDDGIILDANRTFTQMSGYSSEELIGKNIKVLFNNRTLKTKPLRFDLLRSGHTVTNERELKTKSGNMITIEMNSTRLFDGRLQSFFRDITERKKTAETILKSEQKFKAIFNQTFSFLCILDIDGKIIDINNSILNFLGTEKNKIIGKHFWKISFWQKEQKEQDKIKSAIPNIIAGDTIRMETTNIDRNGIFYDIDLSMKPVYDEHEKVIMIITEGRDITNRKKAEIALRDREQLLMSIVDQAAVGISLISLHNKWLQVNPMICEITGYQQNELLNKDVSEITFSNDTQEENKLIQQLLQQEISQANYEKRYVHKNNNIVWVKNILNLVMDNENKPSYFICITEDITEIKQVESELLQSEHKFRNIFNNSSDAIVILNNNFHIIEVNDIFKSIKKLSKNDLVESSFFNHIPKVNINEIQQTFNKVYQNQNVPSLETEFVLRSDKIIKIELTTKLIQYENNNCLLVMIRDITERKNYEKRLLEVIISTEEKEREKFARNLHDDLGPLLSSIKMYLNSFKTDADEKKQKFIIGQVNDIVKESITTTKEISNDLSPHILTNYGLLAAIESFTNKFPNIKINIDSNLKSVRFKNEIEFSLYRIVKELINNTNKHAKANIIKIRLVQNNKIISLTYSDDGIGLDREKAGQQTGMGLFNILSRLKSLNGKYRIPKTEKGMKIIITIPSEN